MPLYSNMGDRERSCLKKKNVEGRGWLEIENRLEDYSNTKKRLEASVIKGVKNIIPDIQAGDNILDRYLLLSKRQLV